MKINVWLLVVVILAAIPVAAQLYDGKHDLLVAPMDRAAQQAHEEYSNVAIAGAAEDVKPQDERYDEMIVPMDQANEKHFDVLINAQTVREQ